MPYDHAYYLVREGEPSITAFHDKRMRHDNLASFAYALHVYDQDAIHRAVNMPGLFDCQLNAVAELSPKQPAKVLDIGCGRGELAAAFSAVKLPVVAIDTSLAALEIARGVISTWGDPQYSTLCMQSFSECKWHEADTVNLCETLEHIPRDLWDFGWPLLVEWLKYCHGRLIVTNHLDYHPIHPDGGGWDHVSLVDDTRFDAMAAEAAEVLVRHASHLVLGF